jgi:hypothetical protein
MYRRQRPGNSPERDCERSREKQFSGSRETSREWVMKTARALLPDDIDEKKIQNTMINMKPEEEPTRGVADVYEKSGLF